MCSRTDMLPTLGEIMSRRTRTHPILSNKIHVALDHKTVYTADFTEHVASLAKRIEHELHVPVEHDPDMNYSAAQMIVIWFDRDYHAITPRDERANWRLNTHVSSKGPFFAFIVLTLSDSAGDRKQTVLLEPRRYWARVMGSEVPPKIKNFETRIANVLKENAYARVGDSVLSQKLEGRTTELGGEATIFDVLLSELY
jgi:hypothetical protein